jgi:hypothetical protein
MKSRGCAGARVRGCAKDNCVGELAFPEVVSHLRIPHVRIVASTGVVGCR